MGDVGVIKDVVDCEVTGEGWNFYEGMHMSLVVGVFEGMRDEVAVVLPVVIDAVVLVVSALLVVAISNDTNNNG